MLRSVLRRYHCLSMSASACSHSDCTLWQMAPNFTCDTDIRPIEALSTTFIVKVQEMYVLFTANCWKLLQQDLWEGSCKLIIYLVFMQSQILGFGPPKKVSQYYKLRKIFPFVLGGLEMVRLVRFLLLLSVTIFAPSNFGLRRSQLFRHRGTKTKAIRTRGSLGTLCFFACVITRSVRSGHTLSRN